MLVYISFSGNKCQPIFLYFLSGFFVSFPIQPGKYGFGFLRLPLQPPEGPAVISIPLAAPKKRGTGMRETASRLTVVNGMLSPSPCPSLHTLARQCIIYIEETLSPAFLMPSARIRDPAAAKTAASVSMVLTSISWRRKPPLKEPAAIAVV